MSVGDFPEKCIIGKNFNVESDLTKLCEALKEGESVVSQIEKGESKGFIIQKKSKAPKLDSKNPTEILEEDVLM